MDEPQKPDKSLQTSFLITLLFMVILVVLGLWLHPEDPATRNTADALVTDALSGSGGSTDGVTNFPPLAPTKRMEVSKTHEVLTDSRLNPNADNDADSFWVATSKGELRFKLYYVDAPDLGTSGADETKALMEYFDGMNEQGIRQLTIQGRNYTSDSLMARPFEVVTRWEMDEEESTRDIPTYLAFVMFIDVKKQMVNLSSLLVRNGLARIDSECREVLPNNKKAEEYLVQLENYKLRSQEDRRGGWAADFFKVQPISHQN